MDKFRIRFEDFKYGRSWFTADRCENYNHAREIVQAYNEELKKDALEKGKDITDYPVVLIVVQHDDNTFSYIG